MSDEILARFLSDRAFGLAAHQTQMAFAGRRFMAALTWERDEKPKWAGRDWRRIKRERHKHMRAAPR